MSANGAHFDSEPLDELSGFTKAIELDDDG
jgi:hypothetical protein